jgi:hypothetical protein
MDACLYDGAVGPRDETNRQWLVGLVVAVAGIVISAVVTLVAAAKLPCPVCGSTPPAAPSSARPVGPLAADAKFTITPSQGPVPAQLTGSLVGFGAGEFVTVRIDSTRIASIQTDPSGAVKAFPITLTASWASAGLRDLTLVAEGETSHTVGTSSYHVRP